MVKMGMMVCDRNRDCTGNKSFMALRDRDCAHTDRDNIRGYLNILVEDARAHGIIKSTVSLLLGLCLEGMQEERHRKKSTRKKGSRFGIS